MSDGAIGGTRLAVYYGWCDDEDDVKYKEYTDMKYEVIVVKVCDNKHHDTKL